MSEHIRVRSVIGRFLEHHRILYFRNNGADDVYLSSADWMGRNLFRRIEVAWPIIDSKLKARVINEGLKPYIDDTCDAWILDADGQYHTVRSGGRAGSVGAQRRLLEKLAASESVLA